MKLSAYRVLFWDFDGVIKDSMEVKDRAFARLFEPFGSTVIERVVRHHQENGGVSRLVKIPLYLREFVGRDPKVGEAERMIEQFSSLVVDEVVASPYVPGALEYLQQWAEKQKMILVTGTPIDEILYITKKLGIDHLFEQIYGAPQEKKTVLRHVMASEKVPAKHCLMIGDALTDFRAAQENGVGFLLRETPQNFGLFQSIPCARVPDLTLCN